MKSTIQTKLTKVNILPYVHLFAKFGYKTKDAYVSKNHLNFLSFEGHPGRKHAVLSGVE